jgi:hypothetical protein
MSDRPHCLYHAFGGGLGHAVRTLALARQLARLVGGRHRLLVNTPFAPDIVAATAREPGLDVRQLDPSAGPPAAVRFVRAAVVDFDPDLFVVDTFPAGLVGELADLFESWSGCPRVLISRGLPHDYIERHHLTAFVARHFDLVLAPGEPSPFAGRLAVEVCPPFRVRDVQELPRPIEALRLLCADRPVVLLAGSGTNAECATWCDETSQLMASWPSDAPPLRLALPHAIVPSSEALSSLVVRHFPLIERLPGVCLLIASAGYNLVHEARALGVSALFRPQPRRFDDQAARLSDDERLAGELLPAIRHRLTAPLPSPSGLPNGAVVAAQRIVGLLRSLRQRHGLKCARIADPGRDD